jgi:hypothetical protein
MAKDCLELDKDGVASDQLERTELIEELWDMGFEFDVWSKGTVRALCVAVLCLYNKHDEDAAEILTELANEELRLLREEDGEDSG